MTSRSRTLALLIAAASLLNAVFACTAMALGTTAWAPVAASGPTNLPPMQSETERVGVDAEGGSFKLIAHHVAARGTGRTGDKSGASATITEVVTTGGTFEVGQRIEGAGIPAATTITKVEAGKLTISAQVPTSQQGSGVSLVATDSGTETTAPIAFNAPAKVGEGPGSVEAALNALALINAGGGSVSVIGGPGDRNGSHPYFVSFDGGALADTDIVQLGADSSALTGGGTHTTLITTPIPGGRGTGEVAVYAQNIGGATSSGTIKATITLPTGITSTATPNGEKWACSPSGPQQYLCQSTDTIGPGLSTPPIHVGVATEALATSGPVKVEFKEGGASEPATYEMPLTISATPALPGIQSFIAGAYNKNGGLDSRAGGHPYTASTGIFVNTKRAPNGNVVPSGEPKDIMVDLPPGFLGNPVAVPQCPDSEDLSGCSTNTIVGVVKPMIEEFGSGNHGGTTTAVPVFNTEAPFGSPAKFKFLADNILLVNVVGSLRSDEDYGVTVGSPNTAQIRAVYGAFFSFWGAPADPSHDSQRCATIETGCSVSSGVKNTAFATQATNCAEEAIAPPVTTISVNTWQNPAEIFHRSITMPMVTGCDQLKFTAGFTFQPSETKADSPASFTADLTVPSEGLTEPEKLTTPEQKKTVVDLPAGVTLNPSAADGLGACSEQQIGLKNKIDPATGLPKPEPMPNRLRFTKDPNSCPDASKIGTIEVKTALLANTLHGDLYLAAQGTGNPFGSLFAVYLVIEDPRTGVFVKLPGEVQPDPATGRLRTVFDDIPQLPFESLRLHFAGGPRAPLATPTTCGLYTTTTQNTPWSAPESGPDFETKDSFAINSGPGGGACAATLAERRFNLGLNAGATDPTAGAFSPFQLQVTRPDGAQELDSMRITTPAGFSASLKGVPYCTEAQIQAAQVSSGAAEQANPACPAASRVGTVLVGAGSGSSPFYTSGKLYLAGPYKGAPLSVVAVTPAVAGPFDLGDVVVRSALSVDPVSAQVTATTDPIPQFLKGVALRIRDVRINLDRPNWALNPTSCDVKAVAVTARGNSGASVNLARRFQVGGCDKLAFKPKLSAKLTGGTHRNDHPSFRAELSYPPGAGYANTRYAQVALPHSEFLDQAHINTVCTRPQFAAHQCPAGSIYGHAEAVTPLLDQPLTGPVYLRSSSNKLPDLVIALRGPDSQPIEVDLDGRIDSIHGGIRTTFEAAPDAPVSKFTLSMKGGNKGLLVNSRNLCTSGTARMTVRLIAQNGKRADQFPPLANDCGKRKHR